MNLITKKNGTRVHAYYVSPRGVSSILRLRMIRSSESRGHVIPSFTIDEIEQWIRSRDSFDEIFNNWKNSGYDKNLSPSIDRIDSSEPYYFYNMRLVTWRDNREYGYADAKSGKYKNVARPVNQYSLSGKYINSYATIEIASKKTGASAGHIPSVCKGKRKQCGGFIWRYSEDKRDVSPVDIKTSRKIDRTVVQEDKFGNVINKFKSTIDASNETGIDIRLISAVCCGKRKTTKGFKFRYEYDNIL